MFKKDLKLSNKSYDCGRHLENVGHFEFFEMCLYHFFISTSLATCMQILLLLSQSERFMHKSSGLFRSLIHEEFLSVSESDNINLV